MIIPWVKATIRKSAVRHTAAAIVLIWAPSFSGWIDSFAEQRLSSPDRGDEVYKVSEGNNVTIELVTYPERLLQGFQLNENSILHLFTASSDSTFWCGPNRPNPHSWLSPSVVCLAQTDFKIHFGPEHGAFTDTLVFRGNKPGVYRVRIGEAKRPQPGIYKIRYIHGGEVIYETKVFLVDR